MKILLLGVLLSLSSATALTATPALKISAHTSRSTRGSLATTPRSHAVRPYYGGGYHTTSHGGNYPGEINSHHLGGHYENGRTGDRYGVHEPYGAKSGTTTEHLPSTTRRHATH